MKAPIFLRSVLASCMGTLLLLQGAISYADDTEIFFGGSTIDSGIRPNVLFILDDSGSMNDNKTPTRMAQLKSAFSTIISSAGSINVGVMALNTKTGGSRLLSPVRPIDESINVKLSSPVLLASGDDASYFSSGTANITDPTLVMGYTGNSEQSVTRSLGTSSTYSTEFASYYVVRKDSVDYACSSKIADAGTVCPSGTKATINSTTGSSGNDGILLFRNLNIPAGVKIESARLVLTRASTDSTRPFSVKIESTKTAAAFNNDESIGSDRNYNNSDLNISSVTPSRNGEELTFDLKSQFEKLRVLSPAANPISDVSLRLRGTGSNSYSWYLGNGTSPSPENTPRLEVTWSNSESVNRTTGLRFQNVAIPKGAIITSARIDFVPAASDDRPVTFSVTAQDSSDTAAFTGTAADFTGRAKTANSSTWTPAEWRTTSPQVYVEGPTVTALVQTVVNNTDWCGNNSMAFFITPTAGSGNRTAFSVDAAKDLQPVLNVKYEGGEDGCLDPILNISVIDNKDDGTQEGTTSGTRTPTLTSSTLSFSNGYIVSRYQKVPVKKGAKVKEAQIIVTPNNTNSGTATVFIENTDNSPELNTNSRNLSDRFPSSGNTTCTFSPSTAGIPVSCSAAGIKTQLEALFARNGWADGNALSLLLKPSSGTLALKSRDSGAGNSIVLRVKLASGGLGTNSYTIRDYTNGIVQGLSASGNTPIVPALNDAAGYLNQTQGKHSGSAPSPITSSCQANYLVLLTDGEANNGNNSTEAGPARTSIASLTGKTCTGDATDSDEKCGRTLVEWMATADQASFDGLNTVTTHTIGFNTSNNAQATTFLKDLARLGKGKDYQAENAGELASAFDDIVQAALATNTTFVNTSAPVNTFNRADNRDELYFALFRPSETDRWIGNLKRYRLQTEGTVATIVDADNAPAIDANTGFFKSSARSFWTPNQDGADIAKGGAALNLPVPDSRKLFTYFGNSPAGVPTALESLVASNTNVTAGKLGDSNMTTVERANLIKYIRGTDTDVNGNDTNRQALGDPIHSSPRLVTYGCHTYTDDECTDPDLSAIIGTNEGFVHAVDTKTGAEQFAFMPEALLPNIKQLRTNAKSTSGKPRLYGMDSTATVWVNDANNNGVIYGDPTTSTTTGLNTGEFVYAYLTMGRGGNNIYALDITNRDTPRMLWQILGGTTPGFEKLAQTWSAPVKTRIKVGTTIKDVLIFAGGYDKDQDDLNTSTSVYAEDNIGNAIYIVDAKTGEKIWSVSNISGHDLTLTKMKYSIPSSVRAIDIQEENGVLVTDPDRLADQFFVGDMGGQVWRFYINNGSSGANLVTPAGTSGDGVFASVGGTTSASARRFYNEPDVAVLNLNGNRSLTVNIGSGYRGHPLNEYIEDRFYSFRTSVLFKSTGEGTLRESDLYNATQNLVQAGDTAQKNTANTAFQQATGGWFITLTNSGEKVLSRALTAGGVLFFNTYEPTTSTAACSAAVGKNRSYSVRLLDATPASIEANGNGTPADRAELSNSGGISGDPQLFCSGNNCWILKDFPIPPSSAKNPPLGKTYWIDTSNPD